MVFLEPMVTREFLLQKSGFEKDIPVPEVFPKAGAYPQTYSLSFDQSSNMYFIALKNMVHHD